MKLKAALKYGTFSFVYTFLCITQAFGQFAGSVQGSVQDPTGALISRATVSLVNLDTGVSATVSADSNGVYRFPSLGAGRYEVTGSASGYAIAKAQIILQTDENRDVKLVLAVGSVTQSVEVTNQQPLLNSSETRLQLTLDTQAFDDLPLNGRNFGTLIALAPGVTGRGNVGNSGNDNFNIETNNEVGSNGRGENGNLYVLDGLDITSNIRPGVLNLSPNPDAVAEVSIQPNTFTVDYGRASSIQTAITTRGGTNQFHGFASDYFTNQNFQALTHFTRKYLPYHSDNISAGVGGPIFKNKTFFFFSVEPLRSLASNGGGSVTFEDPAFVAFAKMNFPTSIGTQLLSKYAVSGVSQIALQQTAAQVFPVTTTGATTTGCGTSSTSFLPCATPVFDSGDFNSSSYRNGLQIGIRLDQNFKNDRVYGTYFRTTTNFGSPSVRPAFTSSNKYTGDAVQANETHTFSPNTLNEVAGSFLRINGLLDSTGDFSVPVVNVGGGEAGFGVGFAQGDFEQKNYHWRDVLTHIIGNHSIRVGYEGSYGQDLALFAPVYDQPSFYFNTVIDLIHDSPAVQDQYGSGLAYNPVTGQPTAGQYEYGLLTYGILAEDTWKVSKKLTANYGIRFDSFGNPHPLSGTILANFHLGAGSTTAQQIAAGYLKTQSQGFNSSIKALSPRVGVAYDPFGTGKTVLHAGFGVYHDAPTLGNDENGLRGNPPSFTVPTFYNDGTTSAPIFALGTSASTPSGFPYPKFGGTPLNSQGGFVGQAFAIGGIDVNLKSPYTLNYIAVVEQQLIPSIVAKIGYQGSHSDNLLTAGGSTYEQNTTAYGLNINKFSGDLFQQGYNPTPGNSNGYRTNPTRLNQSFGSITYAQNGARANYDALVTSLQGRWGTRAFMTASYTWGHAMDNEQSYPTNDLERWYSRSPYDIANAFSFGGSYRIPGFNKGSGLIGRVTDGFTLAGTILLQSGTPFSVATFNGFQPIFQSNTPGSPIIGLQPSSGDYNGDGDNFDYPNVKSYVASHTRKAFLNGLFPNCAGSLTSSCASFAQPGLGQEGNESPNSFRNPGFAQADLNVKKITKINERLSMELRLDIYNVLNRVNLYGVDGNLGDSNLGRSTSQYTPRNMDIGGKISF
ncbi:Oar protein [Acidisarcina polymorpha]|uniref:Oar protein n=1 Tax=Acidisarcina polymorpha TaxID=2211140 RepID=A0A2Z5G436_9BACT|nr:carboxypeptidase regulatory-like domain-containing protein [Acidisarcina polymorpha]AXC13953.1 Oar protein [Acidisarcina polymorpha]